MRIVSPLMRVKGKNCAFVCPFLYGNFCRKSGGKSAFCLIVAPFHFCICHKAVGVIFIICKSGNCVVR